jgi:GPH family glycoside/pentoside/hexuronide:cation symporter
MPKLGASTIFLFGAGSLGTGVYSALPGVLLLFFLTETLGVAPVWASVAIVLPKLWSIVCDPIVGRRSDLHRRRYGTRAPYLLAGALGCAATFAALFAVPSALDQGAALAYVTVVYALAVTAYSVYSVPYVTLPVEMSADPVERTRIVAVRMGFMFVGALAGSAAAPALVVAFGGGREGYARMSFVLAMLAGASAMIAWRVSRTLPNTTDVAGEAAQGAVAPVAGWAVPLRDRPFVSLLGAYGCVAAAIATLTAGMPYLVRHVIHGDESRIAIFFTAFVLASLGGLVLWARVAARVGKGRALAASALMLAIACMPAAALPTGTNLLITALVAGLAVGGLQLLPFALLTDHLRDEIDRAGAYTGIWTAVEKAGLAAGPLVVGALLSMGGFRASSGTPAGPQSEDALVAIRLAVSVAPVVLLGTALFLQRASGRGTSRAA